MKLIQTENCSIVYGTFQGKENQELFRCPRALDNVDLKQYINENRCFLGIEADDVHDDLHNLPGYLGYYRLYFSGGWCGRWMYADKGMSRLDCAGVDGIVEWLSVNFPKGCNYSMREFLSQYPSCSNNRYLLKPLMSEHYKIMFDTKYGNEDYPVRISERKTLHAADCEGCGKSGKQVGTQQGCSFCDRVVFDPAAKNICSGRS